MTAYNESFRVRVVEFLRKGHPYQETAEIFGISMRSICTWSEMAKQAQISGSHLPYAHSDIKLFSTRYAIISEKMPKCLDERSFMEVSLL